MGSAVNLILKTGSVAQERLGNPGLSYKSSVVSTRCAICVVFKLVMHNLVVHSSKSNFLLQLSLKNICNFLEPLFLKINATFSEF